MKNHVAGHATVGAVAAPSLLAGLRARLTALTFGSPHLSAAEKLRANHNAHECEDVDRLARWIVNTERELARREKENHVPPVEFATSLQLEEIKCLLQLEHVSRGKRTQVLLTINRLSKAEARELIQELRQRPAPDDESKIAPLLPPLIRWCSNRQASPLDVLAAARFRPQVDGLTFADLSSFF
jgi:hypothetical protein